MSVPYGHKWSRRVTQAFNHQEHNTRLLVCSAINGIMMTIRRSKKGRLKAVGDEQQSILHLVDM